MQFLTKLRQDLERGIREGVEAVREGTTYMRRRAGELTEEGKRQYRIYGLKKQVQREISEIGGRVYELSGQETNPLLDRKVTSAIARVRKLERELRRLEGAGVSETRGGSSTRGSSKKTGKPAS